MCPFTCEPGVTLGFGAEAQATGKPRAPSRTRSHPYILNAPKVCPGTLALGKTIKKRDRLRWEVGAGGEAGAPCGTEEGEWPRQGLWNWVEEEGLTWRVGPRSYGNVMEQRRPSDAPARDSGQFQHPAWETKVLSRADCDGNAHHLSPAWAPAQHPRSQRPTRRPPRPRRPRRPRLYFMGKLFHLVCSLASDLGSFLRGKSLFCIPSGQSQGEPRRNLDSQEGSPLDILSSLTGTLLSTQQASNSCSREQSLPASVGRVCICTQELFPCLPR